MITLLPNLCSGSSSENRIRHEHSPGNLPKSALRKLVFVAALAFAGFTAQAQQLTGTKAIPGDYATIAAAITDLNTNGVGTGGVTFNVAAGHTETGSNLIITATGTSANPIVFQRSGTGANPKISATAGTSTSVDGIIKLSGTDYITFDAIDVEDVAANTTTTTQMEWGYAVLKTSNTDGSQNVTIKNCGITLQRSRTTGVGIYSANHTPAATTALSATGATADGTNSNNKFFSNTITDAYTGIRLETGSTAAIYDLNNEIGVGGANTITNFGGAGSTGYGIYTIYQHNLKIANNNINGGTGTTTTLYGILTSTANNANTDIYNNNITLTSASTTSTTYGISNSAGGSGTNNLVKIYGNTIQGITANLSTSGTLYGIYNTATAYNIDMYNNTVSNITRTGTGTTYLLYQSASVVNNANIYNNTITDITSTGASSFYLLYSTPTSTTTTNMYGNTIKNVTTTGSLVYGVNSTAGLLNNIYGNTIYNLTATGASSTAFGIVNSGGTTTNIYNNFISDLKAAASTSSDAVRGISISNTSSSNNIGIFYNTIYLNASSSSATTFGSSGIYTSSTPTVDLRNNIVVNVSTPGATGGLTAAYRRSSTTLTSYAATSNTNMFYAGTPAANRVIFTDGTNSDQTIGAYKLRVAPRDNNSVTGMPPFLNITTAPFDLHLSTTIPTQAEGTATPITTPIAITTDFDGNTRDVTSPDMGADEGNFVPQDLTPPTIIYTPLAHTLNATGDRTFTATISDASNIHITGAFVPRVYYRKNNDPYFSKPGTLVSGTTASGTWEFTIVTADMGTLTSGDVVSYYVVAQDMAGPDVLGSSPSGVVGTDVNTITTHPASPNKYLIQAIYSGTLNVGTTETITSLTNAGGAFEILSNNVLGGNVILNITSDLTAETGLNSLNHLLETGAGNYTVTIQPSAAANRTISGSFAGGLIRLNGADRVTIDGNFNGTGRFLTIANTSTATNTAAVHIASLGAGQGAMNNAVKNTNIAGGSNSVTSAFAIHAGGTAISTSGTGAENNGLVIENNVITNAYFGVYARGVSSTGLLTGLNISNNTIGSNTATEFVTYRGIDIQGTTAAVIENNTIFNLQLATAVSNAAIDLGANNADAMVSRNRITGLRSTSTSGYGSYGINISSGTGNSNITIANNVISDIITDGDGTSTTFNAYGIRITGGTNMKVYYNSVNMTGALTNLTTSDLTAALIVTSSSATGLDIRNNIFANRMTGGTGTKSYAVYAASSTTFGTIDYNDYFVGGANGVLAYLGADKTSLADWRAATTQDVNSKNVNPDFVSATNLHTTAFDLNNAGTPIAAITVDFEGDVRNATTPDIGADEFTPIATDLSAITLASPAVKDCYGTAEQVSITIRNTGANAIDFTTTPATVNASVSGGGTQTFAPVVVNTNTLNGGSPLASGASITVPVGTLNMSAPGTYAFTASTVLAGDLKASNDTMATVSRTVVALASGTASALSTTFCQSGSTTLNLTGNAGGDIQWQQATAATGPFTNITGANGTSYAFPAPITQTTYFQALVSCGTNTDTTNLVTVTINDPQVLAVSHDTICAPGTANLSATASAGANINWYDSPTATTPVATGATYSPAITATTTYYAAAFIGGTASVGAASNAIGTGGATGTTTYYQIFDVLSPLTLQGVYVYPAAAGNVVIHLSNNAGTVLQTYTLPVTAANVNQKTFVPINYNLPAGTGYRLGWYTGGVNLFRNTDGASYPYTIPGVISITGSSFVGYPQYWYYVYDFQVSTICESTTRTPVAANLGTTPATPTITRSGNSGQTLTSSAATGNQWRLNGTDIAGATAQTYNTTANGSYTVVVTDGACESAPSAAVSITNTGIKDALAGMNVSIYPNPNNGSFNVKLSGYQQEATLTLYSLTGQLIATEKVKAGQEGKQMKLKNLASGTYLLQVISEKGTQVSRLIVE